MLKRLCSTLPVRLLFIIAFAAPAHAACSKTITFGAIDWPPYIVWNKDGKADGLDIALIDSIFKDAGCDYEIRKIPFKRTLRDLRSGQIDASPFVSLTEERALFGFYSIPVRPEIIGAFMLKSRVAQVLPESFEALTRSGLRVGVVLGGWYGPSFETARKKVPGFQERLTSFENFRDLFSALKTGAIDVAVNDVASGRHMARSLGREDDIALLPFAVHENRVHLLFSRKSVLAADVARIDAAIRSFQASADYSALLSRFLPASLLDSQGNGNN